MNFKTARLSLPVLLAALSVFLAVPVGSSGCGWLSQPGSAQAGALDCAKASVSSKVGSIIAEVIKLSQSGGAGWEDSLSGLGLKVGEDVLGCAVQAALTTLSTPKPSDGGPSHARLAPVNTEAVARLTQFSAKKGYRYQSTVAVDGGVAK